MKYISEYSKVINEYFDKTHTETRRTVLALNEEQEQNKLLISLTRKLYDHITRKITDIDFGGIPDTKGDITKLDNYNEMLECLSVIGSIMVSNKQDTHAIDTIKLAIYNIESRKDKFELAFKLKNELPIIIYSTMTLAVVSSISLLISSSIEYIKLPNSEDFEISLNKTSLKKTDQGLMFNNLDKFNKSCAKGDIDNVIDALNKSNAKNLLGGLEVYMLLNVAIVATLALNIIPLMREIIYFFYYSRVKLSDYLSLQSDLLQMNMYNLDSKEEIDPEEKEKIKEKQSKIVNLFKRLSNAINISDKSATNNAERDITKDKDIKLTIDDLESDSVLF